jgi:hypothetical protein
MTAIILLWDHKLSIKKVFKTLISEHHYTCLLYHYKTYIASMLRQLTNIVVSVTQNFIFSSGFPTKILYEFLIFPMRAIYLLHHRPFDLCHPNNIWWRVQIMIPPTLIIQNDRKVTQPILKYLLMLQFNTIQYRCDYTRAHAGQVIL